MQVVILSHGKWPDSKIIIQKVLKIRDVNYIQELPSIYKITMNEKLKQAKSGKHLQPIDLIAFQDDKKICVVEHLKEYLQKTQPNRMGHSQLLLSYIKPYKPVCKDTVARWIKLVLKLAGIDVEKYTAHSSRAASTSN